MACVPPRCHLRDEVESFALCITLVLFYYHDMTLHLSLLLLWGSLLTSFPIFVAHSQESINVSSSSSSHNLFFNPYTLYSKWVFLDVSFFHFYSTKYIITKNNFRTTMSDASSRACQFYADEIDKSSTSFDREREYSSFKKPRTRSTCPNSGAHTLNEARTRYFKTQLCRKFRHGICTLGSACSFAHCIGELRRREIGNDFNEPKLCRMFLQGQRCSYGYTCRFLHTRPDSVNSRESATEHVIPTGHGKRKSDQSEFKSGFDESFDAEMNLKRVLLKTKLCIRWEMKGHCPFGSICRFAHGQAELGKFDGYSTSECRVVRTSTAATTNVSRGVVSTGTLLEKLDEPFALNCKFKRDELHRISRIYADWI